MKHVKSLVLNEALNDKEEQLKKRVLDKIEDLKNKIINNEEGPEGQPFDYNTLVFLDEELETCLSMWYY